MDDGNIWEHFSPSTPIFDGKTHGFLLVFPLNHSGTYWDYHPDAEVS